LAKLAERKRIMARRLTLVFMCLLLSVGLSACGKRGDLSRPALTTLKHPITLHLEAVPYG
jgi:hypothetical protein